jgi:hypothetical protein
MSFLGGASVSIDDIYFPWRNPEKPFQPNPKDRHGQQQRYGGLVEELRGGRCAETICCYHYSGFIIRKGDKKCSCCEITTNRECSTKKPFLDTLPSQAEQSQALTKQLLEEKSKQCGDLITQIDNHPTAVGVLQIFQDRMSRKKLLKGF